MAGTVGISKSSVSREFIQASQAALTEVMARRFDGCDFLAIDMDGIIVGTRHVIAAIGVDSTGEKHLMGLVSGPSENAQVVKDLLRWLIDRGLSVVQTASQMSTSIASRRCLSWTHHLAGTIPVHPRTASPHRVVKAPSNVPSNDGAARCAAARSQIVRDLDLGKTSSPRRPSVPERFHPLVWMCSNIWQQLSDATVDRHAGSFIALRSRRFISRQARHSEARVRDCHR